jgi:hypothetical protein
MSQQDSSGGGRGFPWVAVIVSAIVLILIGTWLLNLASSGALPTGLGLGSELPDLVRGLVISVILIVIAVAAFIILRREH